MVEPVNMTAIIHGMTVSQQMYDSLHLVIFPSLAIFTMGMTVKLYLWTRGRPYRVRVPLRPLVTTFFNNVLLQRQVLDLSLVRWVIHMCIFWGFLGLFAMSGMQLLLYEIVKIDDRTFLAFNFLWFDSSQLFPQGTWPFIRGLVNELFGFMLLFGVVAAFVRRFIVRPEQLLSRYMDVVSLAWLLFMALSGFMMEGARMIAQGSVGLQNFEPGGWLSAQAFLAAGYTPATLTQQVYDALWFAHVAVAAAFLAYVPFSKLVHVFTSPVSDFVNDVEEAEGEHISRHVPLGEVADNYILTRIAPKKRP